MREVLFPSCSLPSHRPKYPDSGLELPVYIGPDFYWTPGLFGTANFHWSMSYRQIREAGTLPSAWEIWGRRPEGLTGSFSLERLDCLELLSTDWPSAHHE